MNNTVPPDGQMPFVPWMDVQSNNPLEVIGIILFFAIAIGIIYLYLRNKTTRGRNGTSGINFSFNGNDEDSLTYLDDHNVDINDLKSTEDLPKGLKISFQQGDSSTVFDATVIRITDEYFSIFVNPADNQNAVYTPEIGEMTVFFTELNEQRWSFTTTYEETIERNITTHNFAHTYDINLSSMRCEPRVIENIPALFSIIPREMVKGPIPVADLNDIAQGEIPATVSDISVGGCAIHTYSPLPFKDGDFAVLSFILPNEINENTIFSSVNNVTKIAAGEGGGSILNLKFMHIDQEVYNTIDSLVSDNIENEIIY